MSERFRQQSRRLWLFIVLYFVIGFLALMLVLAWLQTTFGVLGDVLNLVLLLGYIAVGGVYVVRRSN